MPLLTAESLPEELFSVETIRQLETIAMQECNISESKLMQTAGSSAFAALQQRWPQAQRIVVFCGKGNNAGDGYVVARLALAAGLKVTILQLPGENTLKPVAQAELDACIAANITIKTLQLTEEIIEEIVQADVAVDALLGIGLSGNVREPISTAIEFLNESGTEVLTLDVPSGLDADTGQPLGIATVATATVTFIGLKTGLVTGSAADYVGELWCTDLDLPAESFLKVEPTAYRMTQVEAQALLPPRPRSAHKGYFGHVLIIGGDHGFAGAARLAAGAALRSGAGLVSVATRPEHVHIIVSTRPEIMCHAVSKAEQLTPLLAKATVVAIGPGLGQSTWSQQLFELVLQSQLPLVVDADALNLLAKQATQKDNWVLTPHPAEAARLLTTDTQQVQADRYQAAKKLQQRFGGVTVLKGAGTIIQAADSTKVCDAGNPGMATAGMGDVLTGVIASLLAQGLDLEEAAQAGVYFHARAADRAARRGMRGMLATEVIKSLRAVIN